MKLKTFPISYSLLPFTSDLVEFTHTFILNFILFSEFDTSTALFHEIKSMNTMSDFLEYSCINMLLKSYSIMSLPFMLMVKTTQNAYGAISKFSTKNALCFILPAYQILLYHYWRKWNYLIIRNSSDKFENDIMTSFKISNKSK